MNVGGQLSNCIGKVRAPEVRPVGGMPHPCQRHTAEPHDIVQCKRFLPPFTAGALPSRVATPVTTFTASSPVLHCRYRGIRPSHLSRCVA